MPSGQEAKTIGEKKYCIDLSIGARKVNSVMVMIIIHIAYITCIVNNDAWHVYDVIGVFKKNHGGGRNSYFAETAILWLAGTVMGKIGPVTFNEASNTVVG